MSFLKSLFLPNNFLFNNQAKDDILPPADKMNEDELIFYEEFRDKVILPLSGCSKENVDSVYRMIKRREHFETSQSIFFFIMKDIYNTDTCDDYILCLNLLVTICLSFLSYNTDCDSEIFHGSCNPNKLLETYFIYDRENNELVLPYSMTIDLKTNEKMKLSSDQLKELIMYILNVIDRIHIDPSTIEDTNDRMMESNNTEEEEEEENDASVQFLKSKKISIIRHVLSTLNNNQLLYIYFILAGPLHHITYNFKGFSQNYYLNKDHSYKKKYIGNYKCYSDNKYKFLIQKIIISTSKDEKQKIIIKMIDKLFNHGNIYSFQQQTKLTQLIDGCYYLLNRQNDFHTKFLMFLYCFHYEQLNLIDSLLK